MYKILQDIKYENATNFGVLTAMLLKIQVFFCDVTLCHWVSGSWHFEVS
jgi:hypothetical protein